LRDARRSVDVIGSLRNQLVLCVFTTTPCVERIISAPTNQAEIVFHRCAATPSRTGVAANFHGLHLSSSLCCAQQTAQHATSLHALPPLPPLSPLPLPPLPLPPLRPLARVCA